MAKIVLSYRRDDSGTISNWLYEKLVDRYGKASIFRDIDSIQPTENFRKRIGRALRDCDFVVAIIGPGWQGRETEGKSRINADNDWVRVEVETALQLDIPLLPVLVEGAEMPQPDDLPASLREMTEINALPISSASSRFYDDLERLYSAIEKVTGAAPGGDAAPVAEAPQPAPQPTAVAEPAPPAPPPQPAPEAAPDAVARPAAKAATAAAAVAQRAVTARGRTFLPYFVLPAVVMSAFWALSFVTGSGGDGGQVVVFLISAIAMVLLGAVIRQKTMMNIAKAALAGAFVGTAAAVTAIVMAEVNIDTELGLVILVFVGGGTVATVIGFVLGGRYQARRPPA